MSVKPILFNTDMVKAILGGRKSATRRVVEFDRKEAEIMKIINKQPDQYGQIFAEGVIGNKRTMGMTKVPFYRGDILYVRETWCDRWLPDGFLTGVDRYGYKADGIPSYGYWGNDSRCKMEAWIPSIHMPKEAARIWLKVTNVRVERVQDITGDQAVMEGTKEKFPPLAQDEFRGIWDSTVKKADIDRYGWKGNPWDGL
jgi:hypothetical protein